MLSFVCLYVLSLYISWFYIILYLSFTELLQFLYFTLNVTSLSVVFQMTISQLKAELEKGPQEAAVYTQQIHQLQSNLNNLQQQSQVCKRYEI